MNAIEIIALIVSAASVVAGLVSAVYLLVWLMKQDGAALFRGEWPPSLQRPLIAATTILAIPVIRGLCAMVVVWQEGLK